MKGKKKFCLKIRQIKNFGFVVPRDYKFQFVVPWDYKLNFFLADFFYIYIKQG